MRRSTSLWCDISANIDQSTVRKDLDKLLQNDQSDEGLLKKDVGLGESLDRARYNCTTDKVQVKIPMSCGNEEQGV